MGNTPLARITDAVDDFLYEWQSAGGLSLSAAKQLLGVIFRQADLSDAQREFMDSVAEGRDPFDDRK